MRFLYFSPIHPFLTKLEGDVLPRWQTQACHVRALEHLGHQVTVIAYTTSAGVRPNPLTRLTLNVASMAKAFGAARVPVDGILLSLGADVLFTGTMSWIQKHVHAPLVILSGVSPITDGNPRDRAMALFADLVVTNDASHARQWKGLGAKRSIVLPISAIDPLLHYPRPVDRDIDVVFAGTMTPRRRSFLDALRSKLSPGVTFETREYVWEEDYALLLSRAKIALNPIRPEMNRGANLRMFEIPAFGAMELGSFSNPQWLKPSVEMILYKDPDDAAGKIAYYLVDESRRTPIAKRAYQRVMKEHTFVHRFRRLVKLI